MSWMFWRKQERPTEEPKTWNPRVTFELVETGRVHVTCDWPEHDTAEEKAGMATTFASMLHFINDGQLLPLVQQAVAVAGRLKDDERLSEYMLDVLLKQSSQEKHGRGRPGPVVHADEVFSRD